MSPTGRRPCSYRPKLLCLAARVLLAPLLACSAGGVAAQEVLEFDIPAGKMSVALLRISQVAEVLLSFPPELVDQQTAPAVRGRFTLEQALSLALQSSGLVAEKLSTGTFVVRPVEPKATDAAGAAGTAAEDPPPASTGAPVAVLPRVVVNGLGLPRADEGLRGLRGWSATRGDTPLAEVPQAVSVLTPQALELQGGTTSGEALGHVPGVTEILDLQGTTARFMPAYMVRGFAAANALSGMRTNRGAIPLDAVFLERIEVPKGPSGVVSGMAGLGSAFVSELGGTINMERKRAGPGTPAGIAQTLDSTDGGTLRFIGDVGGSWPGDTDWRIIGYASRSGRTDGGYDGKNSAGLLGSLQWGRGPFSAGLALQVDGSRNVPAPTSRGGLVRLPDNTLAIVPLEPGVATPLNPQDRLQARGADLDLELGWQLLPKWRVDLRGRLEEVRNEWTRTEILFKPLLSVPNSNRLHVMQVNLSGELATGAATHKIVLGLDAQRNQKQDTRFDATGAPLLTQITEQRQGVLLMDQISFGR